MSSTQAIENLINGYATSEDSSFLIPNVTEDFIQSENCVCYLAVNFNFVGFD